VTALDVSDRTVLERPIDGAGAEHRLGLESLRAGLYLVRVSDGRSTVTQKLVLAQ
jgi:hypothetical protein